MSEHGGTARGAGNGQDDDGAAPVRPEIPLPEPALPEPQLGPAEISSDVAASTSLAEVEAEAARTAAEAESVNPVRGDRALRPPAAAGPAAQQPPATPAWQAPTSPVPVQAGPLAGWNTGPQGPGGPQGTGKGNRKLFIILGAVLAALAVLGLLVWLAVSLLLGLARPAGPGTAAQSATSPAAQGSRPAPNPSGAGGLILAAVSPLDWIRGDCLRGYAGADQPADLVDCSAAHGAQLVGTDFYAQSDSFPGTDALKAKAKEVCAGVSLLSAADNYNLQTVSGYPSEDSWTQQGDRRVDCIVYDPTGDNIKENLLP